MMTLKYKKYRNTLKGKENKKKSKRKLLTSTYVIPREDKGDREGIPHTYPIPQVIRLESFLESG